VESKVVKSATRRLFSNAVMRTLFVRSASYHFVENPSQRMLSFEELNEKTTNSAIGR
jgi:hypothetical protein